MKRSKTFKKSRLPERKKKKAPPKKIKSLTDREKQVVKLICYQLTSREMGKKLGVSLKTVESHKFQIFKKIKVRNNVGAALYAIKHGIYKI